MATAAAVGRAVRAMAAVRNIGIMAHIDAGKTTVTERMLFYSGKTRSIGEVHDGDTVMDYMQQERERGITISSAAISFPWNDHTINLIDTPGHVDFTVEVERSLRVLDGAVAVFDAVAGVEAQSLTVWRQARSYNLPRIAFVNKMDRTGANIERTVNMMRAKLNTQPLLLHIPVGEWADFSGVIDLVPMEVLDWEEGDGRNFTRSPLPPSHALYDKAMQARSELLETLAELDDPFMEKYIEADSKDGVCTSSIDEAIRRTTLSLAAVPVLCGSALKNKGIQSLLDAVTKYLPSPLDRPPTIATANGQSVKLLPDPKADLCAFAFKVLHDQQRGPLVFLRLYSGTLSARSSVLNVTSDCRERIIRLLQVSANSFTEVETCEAGHIIAAVGLKSTCTGDTIISDKSALRIMLPTLTIPDPVFFCTIEASSTRDEDALEQALAALRLEDPSLRVAVDEASGQRVISGMGELHLEIISDRLKREFKLDVDVSSVRVSYKESVGSSAAHTCEFDGMVAGKRQTASVSLAIEPTEEDTKATKYTYTADLDASSPLASLPASHPMNTSLQRGVESGLSRGPVLGFPVVGVAVTVTDASGSSDAAIALCAAECLREALNKAGGRLLEPVMALEIAVEEEHVGVVLNDLTSQRRATITSIDMNNMLRAVHAEVPLSTMVGYSSILRSITAGHASMTMSFARYAPMTGAEQKTVVQQYFGY